MTARSCQLLVAGGGVAGTCAALAAARSGVETLLVESRGWLGGTGACGLLRHICGLYGTGEDLPEGTLNGGLCDEVVLGLAARAPRRRVRTIGQVRVLPYEDSDLRAVLTERCGAEERLRVLTSSSVTGASLADGRIDTVNIDTPGGPLLVTPRMAIDCSGNANLAALAGAGCLLSPPGRRQLAGFTIRLNGLEDADELLPVRVPYQCAKGVERGVLPPLLRFTTFFPGDSPDEGFCKLSLDGEDGPERDRRARQWARDLLAYLGQELPAFSRARISETALTVLEREGRRVAGEYTLTGEDVLSGRKFPDGVVKNAWPMEQWDGERGIRYRYLARGEYYEIPLACLRVAAVPNLLAAGRCISATPEALASTRVMGTCMALGEQAGLEAVRWLAASDDAHTQIR